MSTNINLKNSTDTTFSITHSDGANTKVIDSKDIAVAIDTVADFPANPNNGDVVIVRDISRGGTFIYDSSEVAGSNDGTNFDGWIRQYSGAVNVKWFGAKGNWDGTEGNDDSVAIQKAITTSYLSATQNGWREDTIPIFIPNGKYKITQSNYLFTGCSAGRFSIKGAGIDQTSLVYVPSSTTSTDYFINNNQIFGFTYFEDLTFEASGAVNNWFMNGVGGGSGNAQSLYFTKVRWLGYPNIIKVTGTSMMSEVTFRSCKITDFTGIAFSLNNEQAVNWRFYDTDVESFSGVLFKFYAGTSISWYQGSIIPIGSGIVCDVDGSANPNLSGSNNIPTISFYGARFEMRDTSKMVRNQREAFLFIGTWYNCGMGGSNLASAPTTHAAIDFIDITQLYFYNCNNFQNYRVKASTINSTSWQYTSIISLKDCDVNAKDMLYYSKDLITSTGNNVSGTPIFVNDTNGVINHYNKYNCIKISSQTEKVIAATGIETNNRLYLYNIVTNTPVDVWTVDLSYSFISKIKVVIQPAWSGGYGSETFTVSIKNKTKTTTYATATLNTSSGLVLEYIPTFGKFMGYGEGIIVEFIPTSIWTSTFGIEARAFAIN